MIITLLRSRSVYKQESRSYRLLPQLEYKIYILQYTLHMPYILKDPQPLGQRKLVEAPFLGSISVPCYADAQVSRLLAVEVIVINQHFSSKNDFHPNYALFHPPPPPQEKDHPK